MYVYLCLEVLAVRKVSLMYSALAYPDTVRVGGAIHLEVHECRVH